MRQATWDGKVLATIWFQSQRLPPWAILLDVTTTNDVIVDSGLIHPDSDTAVWWWRFSICVGTVRRERSAAILLHADLLQRELTSRSSDYRGLIERNFAGSSPASPDEVLVDWLDALAMITAEAHKAPECEWYGGYEEPGPFWSDPAFAPPWPVFAQKRRIDDEGLR